MFAGVCCRGAKVSWLLLVVLSGVGQSVWHRFFSGAAPGSDITPVCIYADEEHLGMCTVVMIHNRCRKVRGRIHIAVLGIPLGHVEGCPIVVAHTLL